MLVQRTTPALRQVVRPRNVNIQPLVGRRLQSTAGETAEKSKAKLVSHVCTCPYDEIKRGFVHRRSGLGPKMCLLSYGPWVRSLVQAS